MGETGETYPQMAHKTKRGKELGDDGGANGDVKHNAMISPSIPLAVHMITDPSRLLPKWSGRVHEKKVTLTRKAKEIQIEHRRGQVAALVRSGARYRDIAQTLDISIPTVARDMEVVRRMWRDEAVHDVDVARQIDLVRLDRMWLNIDTAIGKGNLKAILVGLKILARRASMFGYDKPKEIHVKTDATIQIMNIVGPVVMQRIENARDEDEVSEILFLEARKDPRLMDVIEEVMGGAA